MHCAGADEKFIQTKKIQTVVWILHVIRRRSMKIFSGVLIRLVSGAPLDERLRTSSCLEMLRR